MGDLEFELAPLSVLQSYGISEEQNWNLTTFIDFLPPETLIHIFSYLNTADVATCARTCQLWRLLITESEALWKIKCHTLTESKTQIQQDRIIGYSWKETFKRNFGSNGIKHLWRLGLFSNPSSVEDLPDKPFCSLNTDSWGEILQWELDKH